MPMASVTQSRDSPQPEVNVPPGSPYRRKLIVIGISGATNAGKTTMANRLIEAFPGSEVIHQDHFFRDTNDPNHEHVHELNHHNWDTFSAVDIASLIETARHKLDDLTRSMEDAKTGASSADSQNPTNPVFRPKLLIIEGILTLNVSELYSMMDRKYYFTLPFEVCQARRLTRNYDPPDVPGYFDQIVWPMHVKLSGQLREQYQDIDFIPGTIPLDEIFSSILTDLSSFLNYSDPSDVTHANLNGFV